MQIMAFMSRLFQSAIRVINVSWLDLALVNTATMCSENVSD